MAIYIEKVRIRNFRSLRDVEVHLAPITLLVGANNAGKTTFLKALNSVLGIAKNQINRDDLCIDKDGNTHDTIITIDLKIVPVDDTGKRESEFNNQWQSKLGGANNISTEANGEFFAVRAAYTFGVADTPEITYTLFTDWNSEALRPTDFKGISQIRNNLKLYFIDAQRDILEDAAQRTSFFGRLVSQLDYGEHLGKIKEQIEKLNEDAIANSPVLAHLQTKLSKLNETTQTQGTGVTLTPFPKNIRDLHKGMKVYFQDKDTDAFSMEYHGMGTRSWASIITAGAYTAWEAEQIQQKIDAGEVGTDLLFPVFALEEPEAHLHPNAQRTLYQQLKDFGKLEITAPDGQVTKIFGGQTIISTHSPYIAGQAELSEIRHFYKDGDSTVVSAMLFDFEDRVRIQELTERLNAERQTPEAYLTYSTDIQRITAEANSKLSEADNRKIKREVLLSKGEILFSRAIVLFEGPTEQLALPVFAQKYFLSSHFEKGLTFINVGGKLNYSPFLKVAKFFRIPVFILSDGDGTTEQDVKDQIQNVFGNDIALPIFAFEQGLDFEKYLLSSGYKAEILLAIDAIEGKNSYIREIYIPTRHGKPKKKKGIRSYMDEAGAITETGETDAILDCMSENKTEFAEAIAEQIVASGKAIPPKIRELFDSIATALTLNQPSA